jgi:hypothetical protein
MKNVLSAVAKIRGKKDNIQKNQQILEKDIIIIRFGVIVAISL